MPTSRTPEIPPRRPPDEASGGHDWRLGRFPHLMPKRIQEILLVSSPYDSFILEEDGLLTEMIYTEYLDLGLTHSPTITRVSTGEEALGAIRTRPFDLVITLLRLGDMDVAKFAQAVRQIKPELPVVLLVANNWELARLTHAQRTVDLDAVYVWHGDAKVILAIVKVLEDRLNAEHDTRVGRRGRHHPGRRLRPVPLLAPAHHLQPARPPDAGRDGRRAELHGQAAAFRGPAEGAGGRDLRGGHGAVPSLPQVPVRGHHRRLFPAQRCARPASRDRVHPSASRGSARRARATAVLGRHELATGRAARRQFPLQEVHHAGRRCTRLHARQLRARRFRVPDAGRPRSGPGCRPALDAARAARRADRIDRVSRPAQPLLQLVSRAHGVRAGAAHAAPPRVRIRRPGDDSALPAARARRGPAAESPRRGGRLHPRAVRRRLRLCADRRRLAGRQGSRPGLCRGLDCRREPRRGIPGDSGPRAALGRDRDRGVRRVHRRQSHQSQRSVRERR